MAGVALTAAPSRLERAAYFALLAFAASLQVSIAAANILLALTAILWLTLIVTRRERVDVPAFFWPLLAYAAYRYRAEYSRDGAMVQNSNGQYLDSGLRAAVRLGPQRDLILGLDSRLHSGLGVDEGLPTSGVASGSVSVGMEWRKGLTSVQPYVRGQGGVLQQRGLNPSPPSQSFTGMAFGLVAVTRF